MKTSIARRDLLAAAAGSALVGGCATLPPVRLVPLPPGESPAPIAREFRAAWVATVANIDWPRASGLPLAAQQAQLHAIVERAAALGLNALVVQVRPAADALYASALEPASEYASGTQGLAPGYDPLALWVEAAHARGLELHAWFNPFRARHPSARSPLAAQHIAVREPAWAKAYGDLLWLDPGEPGAVAHTLAVIDDVVRRYDIDGVHIDDYFYPYPVKGADGNDLPFADDAAYARSGSTLAKDDWRRDNVNRFVRAMHERVHAAKPWVKVGISPFALPRRERRPAGIEGFDPYARLYADAERWLEEGWLDYIAPQLYWPMAQRAQAFDVLLGHWARTNTQGRHLWPGLFTSRIGLAPNPWPADEIANQLAHLRANAGQASGHIHFSMAALMDDRARLLEAARAPALVPASPWLGAAPPGRPGVSVDRDAIVVVADRAGPPARWFSRWQRLGARWEWQLVPAGAPLRLPLAGLTGVVVSAIGRSGVESERVSLALFKQD
ncbi:MAG TPA: family 10 glycosylhydrolase [Burkholderiaceae bacterium]|nr:family 10 glycosylhydrolase [Burkholderiaceae bacterium]